jgi:hypothetical protein
VTIAGAESVEIRAIYGASGPNGFYLACGAGYSGHLCHVHRDGRDGIRYKGFAKLLFQSATIRTAVKHGNYVANPSMAMQNVLASTLGLLGELLGYKAVNPKYVGE